MELSKCSYALLGSNISLVYIVLGLLISLQPPFYPSEASKKGATPAQYGFVFGIANLSLFIFSPIFGKYGSRYGAKLCFTTGSILQGVSGFLFAFLALIQDCTTFIALSYVLRFIEGLGTAMAWSSAIGILMKIFPNKVAGVMSWTQTFFGLGYMLGPAVGAALYEVGGFMFPFILVGAISTTLSLLLIVTIPDVDQGRTNELDQPLNPDPEDTSNNLGLSTLLSCPRIVLAFFDLFCTLCGNGMLESMLEPHLRDQKASTLDVGITFLIFGCCYMLGNVSFGTFLDKTGYPIAYSIMGNFLFIICFLLIGPAPFIPISPSVKLIQGMMALAGLGYASSVVSSFSRSYHRVLQMGYPDNIHTHILITGIWMSAFALGNFIGPTIAGFIVELKGFEFTTLLFLCIYAFMVILDSLEVLYLCCHKQTNEFYE
eukprot:maker-scaffold1403_size43014-snap-gene-0.10 protein:Tk08420 transcript:maker-scaffold1403_size43014-snap-gene-0.10-mRNA-1 annotation:"chromaffin granule amine transporter"